jgi:anti-sigma factor RsiW
VKRQTVKKYKRYDPFTGAMVQVTKDDPRYSEWRRTRGTVASRKKQMLREDPVEYAQTFGTQTVKRTAQRKVEQAAGRIVRRALPAVAASPALQKAAGALPVIGTVGLLAAAGILGGWLMDKATKTEGDRLNALSLAFVKAQEEMKRRAGVRTWLEVPSEPRNKLYREYLDAIKYINSTGLSRFQPRIASFE